MLVTRDGLFTLGPTWSYSTPDVVYVRGEDNWPKELRDKLYSFQFPQPVVTEVENVLLLGPVGVGVHDQDVILDTAYSGRLDVMDRNKPYLTWAMEAKRLPTTKVLDLACSMVGVWASNYFHWILEFLPRLEGVERYEQETGKRPVMVLEHNPPKFVTDSLDMLGYEYVCMEHKRFLVKKLVVPTFERHDGRISPNSVRWLRNKFTKEQVKTLDIYISREHAKERRVLNENKFKSNYTVFYNERLSFSEQVKLYGTAKSITAPHGAGLTNMVWADEVEVTELFGSYINPCFMTLAAACGHTYKPVFCEPVGKDMQCVL